MKTDRLTDERLLELRDRPTSPLILSPGEFSQIIEMTIELRKENEKLRKKIADYEEASELNLAQYDPYWRSDEDWGDP